MHFTVKQVKVLWSCHDLFKVKNGDETISQTEQVKVKKLDLTINVEL